METTKDIAAAVGTDRADPYELVQWLWNYFGGHMKLIPPEIIISNNSTEIIRAKFSKRHRLTTLKIHNTSQGRIAEIRDAISRDLLSDSIIGVGTEVFFSTFPVDGFFKFEDKLLIRPVPIGAPKPRSRSFGEQPFLLEFKFKESPNLFVTNLRKAQEVRHLAAILAVFLEGVINPQSHTARGHWVNLHVNAPGEEPRLESKYLAGQYLYSAVERPANDFSSVEGLPAIIQTPAKDYFTRWDQVTGRSLEIPDSLPKLFTTFFSMQPEERAKFVRASWWYAQAKSAYHTRSYAYIALVMAIETLAERKSASERCPSCNRELENGPTKNFRRFLDEYAPDFDEAKELKRELYNLRSDLVHGGNLFLEDSDGRFFPWIPRMVKDDQKLTLLYRLARIALVNWLEKNEPK